VDNKIIGIAKEMSKSLSEDSQFIEWLVHNTAYMQIKFVDIALEEFKEKDVFRNECTDIN
jgi:hypothetical protein